MSLQVKIHEKETALEAIKQVRNDKSETNWVLFGHLNDDPNTLFLEGSGSDGYDGLIARIDDAKFQYGLLRVTTKVDLSVTVKFVYIRWQGEKVGFAKRGRYSVVHGEVVKFFHPFHVDFDVTEKKEVTLPLITAKVEMAAGLVYRLMIGNADYVRSADFAIGKPEFGKNQNQKVASSLGKNNSQPNAGGVASFDRQKSNEKLLSRPQASIQATPTKVSPELEETLKQVRNDKSSLHWVAAGFQDNNLKNQLVLLGSGESESIEDAKQFLENDKFGFVLQRVTDIIDGHKTIKFVFVNWIGAQVSMMSGLSQAFSPFHVDFVISDHKEINDKIVQDKVSFASGSKSHVQ